MNRQEPAPIIEEMRCRARIERRGRDRRGLTLFVAETIRRAMHDQAAKPGSAGADSDHGRDEMPDEENYSPISLNE